MAEQSRLMQIANEVEEQNHDEPGTLQEVILAPADFDEIKRMLFDKGEWLLIDFWVIWD